MSLGRGLHYQCLAIGVMVGFETLIMFGTKITFSTYPEKYMVLNMIYC